MMLAKAACIYLVARATRSSRGEALDRAVLMAQGGEFAFVLLATAQDNGVIGAAASDSFTAVVVLSMVLTPLVQVLLRCVLPRATASMDGVEAVDGQSGSVLIIGFGRFGQVMSQSLLARDVDVTVIDVDLDWCAPSTASTHCSSSRRGWTTRSARARPPP